MRPEEFPCEFSFHRSKNGLTQKELAQALDVSDRSIKMWEAGTSVPRKGIRIQMAQIFGLPSVYFLWPEELPESVISQMPTETDQQELRLLRDKLSMVLTTSNITDESKRSLNQAIESTITKAHKR